MSYLAKGSLGFTLILALGYFIACSSTGTNHGASGTTGNTSVTTTPMLSSTFRNTAIFPNRTGSQSAAALFGFGVRARADATVTNPSALPQSFELMCYGFGGSHPYPTGIHAAFGNSGLVPMTLPNADVSIGITNSCSTVVSSIGADENGTPTGFPIFLSGTINSLVAYGIFVSGNSFRCLDITDTSVLQDNTFVRAYYDLANDTIILGSGTTQLTLSCPVTIPPGDDITEFSVQWVKS